jgi:pyruvate dehydrogenase E2 component (dihydrolipoamide acetyltransferase)
MPIEITMPRLSDTMESGTIIKWNVKEGDTVSAGDVIADVETDKATMEMTAFDDGTITKVNVAEGQQVDVGTVIAILSAEGEDPGESASVSASASANGTAKDESTEATSGASGSSGSESSSDEPETEARPASSGASRQSSSTSSSSSSSSSSQSSSSPSSSNKNATGSGAASAPTTTGRTSDGRLRVTPVARRLADEHHIDLNQLQGTGPSGRIIKRDVLDAVDTSNETAASVVPSGGARTALAPTRVSMGGADQAIMPGSSLEPGRIPLSNIRQTIARRLQESKQTIPHYQVTVSLDMDGLLELRETLNEQLKPQQVKLSVNDFLVKACALSIHQHPEFNASWGGDHLLVHEAVNIGVAVSLPSERGGGLVVATIRHADQKSLRIISAETRGLAHKARERGLTVEEMSDSTFTISNLGMFGVEHFTAIINPPNSAILAVGAAVEQPVVRDHELAVGHVMRATLSLDHRIIDGAMAAEFLQTLKQMIESPATLLV